MSSKEASRDRRSQRREERRRKQTQQRIIIAVVAVLVVGGIVAAILLSGGPSPSAYANLWQEIPQMDDISHVAEGTELQYTTNPPTSGQHFDNPAPAGFYDQILPDGNLVHSMEHGYVILWYNCDGKSDEECDTIRGEVERIINNLGGFKLIGMERPGMDTTFAITSWMVLDKFDDFDADRIRAFYRANQSHPRSPEPTAQ